MITIGLFSSWKNLVVAAKKQLPVIFLLANRLRMYKNTTMETSPSFSRQDTSSKSREIKRWDERPPRPTENPKVDQMLLEARAGLRNYSSVAAYIGFPTSSVGAPASKNREQSPPQDPEVETQRPVLDVAHVEENLLVEA